MLTIGGAFMHSLKDDQLIIVYHGTEMIYHGLACDMHKKVNHDIFDTNIEIITSYESALVVMLEYGGRHGGR